MGDVVRAYPTPSEANSGKLDRVAAILPEWQKATTRVRGILLREFYETGKLPRYLDTRGIASVLSQRQLKSVVNQVRAALRGWLDSMVPLFRDLVTHSSLSAEDKVLLYRVNAHRAWFRREFALDGAPVEPETLRLARAMFRHLAARRHPKPDLRKVRTMLMDGPIAHLSESRTSSFSHWLQIATLERRKPVRLPLAQTRYAAKAAGTYANYAQVTVGRSGDVAVSLVKKSPAAATRTAGRSVGLDWGLQSVFSTSEGQLLGIQIYEWLQDRDRELTELTTALQRQQVSLKTNKRYRALNRRIREHVRNEVGRILNRLAQDDLKELVVEKLDFRHGGLSRRLNRIVTRAGRAAVDAKLQDLTERHGIAVTRCNPAYTSQTCAGCGFTHRLNRNGTKFRCRFCHKRLHADVNAARNLVARRSDDETGGLYVGKQKIKVVLDQRFRENWNLSDTTFDELSDRAVLRRRSSPSQVPA